MKKFYTIAFGATLLFSVSANSQCTVNVTASTNDTVCSGTSSTLTANVVGPLSTLNTTMAAGNNHRGNMFDITALNTVTITSFDASPMAATTIAIYYKTGTWVGFDQNSSAWTLIGSAAVPGAVLPTPVPVPVPVNVTIPAGQTYAFYVTSTNTAVSLNYTNGTTTGNVYTSDANIQFREGCGHEYPFLNAPFAPRIWNGVIHYTTPGTPTYLWNTLATTTAITETINSSASYFVEVTVPGCPSTMYDTINMVVSTPIVGAGADFAVCSGDTVTLSGSGALSYAWDQSVVNNVPFIPGSTQQYIIQGTDLYSCTDVDTVNVIVNSLPNVTAPGNMAVCMGDTVTLAGAGATSYVWDNSIMDNVAFVPSATLMYHVTGTDANGCVNWDSTLVTVNTLPVVGAGNDTTVCEGAAVTLNGTGATSYSWSGGITNAVPFNAWMNTTYTVTGTDTNGCEAIDNVDVNIYVVNAAVSVVNETITANDTNAISYQWIDCNTMQPIAGETNYWFTAASNGSYAVIVTDSMCSDTSACEIILSTGIAANGVQNISVYPNPTDGFFTLNTGVIAVKVEVTDITGNVISSVEPQTANLTVSLFNEESGLYFVKVTSANGEVTTIKVVKQ